MDGAILSGSTLPGVVSDACAAISASAWSLELRDWATIWLFIAPNFAFLRGSHFLDASKVDVVFAAPSAFVSSCVSCLWLFVPVRVEDRD